MRYPGYGWRYRAKGRTKGEWNTKPIKGNIVAYQGVTIKPEWKDCVWGVIFWREKRRRKVNNHLLIVWGRKKNDMPKVWWWYIYYGFWCRFKMWKLWICL
jgi:hypothetical protein